MAAPTLISVGMPWSLLQCRFNLFSQTGQPRQGGTQPGLAGGGRRAGHLRRQVVAVRKKGYPQLASRLPRGRQTGLQTLRRQTREGLCRPLLPCLILAASLEKDLFPNLPVVLPNYQEPWPGGRDGEPIWRGRTGACGAETVRNLCPGHQKASHEPIPGALYPKLSGLPRLWGLLLPTPALCWRQHPGLDYASADWQCRERLPIAFLPRHAEKAGAWQDRQAYSACNICQFMQPSLAKGGCLRRWASPTYCGENSWALPS